MKTCLFILAIQIVSIFILSSCAPGFNELEKTPNKDGDMAGFFSGLWHGVISPITFIISLFSDSVNFYEVHNSGGWYNLGFVL